MTIHLTLPARRGLRLRALPVLAVLATSLLLAACDAGEDGPATPPPTPTAAPEGEAPTPTPEAASTPTPAATPEPTPEPTPTPIARPAPTDAEACRATVAADSSPDCTYQGPLFDAHFHPVDAIRDDASTPSTALCDLLQRDGVSWGLALYELPPDPDDAGHHLRVVEGSRACAVPLVQPMDDRYGADAGARPYDGFRRGDYSAEALDRWLAPQGPLRGVGEVALYFRELHDVSLDHPLMATVLQAVDERGGVAMIHPRVRGSHHSPVDVYPNLTTADEIADAAGRYPNTTFVIHGGLPFWDMLAPHFDDHPNLYFSYETVFWLMEAHIPFASVTATEFNERFDAHGLDALIDTALEGLLPRIEEHPNRIMWGLDRYLDWHFEPQVSERWLEVTRLVIARLPEETQNAYAFENALRVLGAHLDPPVR